MSTAKPIPDGASVVMPMLVCRDAGAELDFCKTTFDAVERVRRPGPDGAVARVGDHRRRDGHDRSRVADA